MELDILDKSILINQNPGHMLETLAFQPLGHFLKQRVIYYALAILETTNDNHESCFSLFFVLNTHPYPGFSVQKLNITRYIPLESSSINVSSYNKEMLIIIIPSLTLRVKM